MQTQDDASNFKEENVKRDQKGRFAKHAEKVVPGAAHAGDHLLWRSRFHAQQKRQE